jgi:hypothetical protein
MSGPFAARVGAVLSADIAVPDREREVRFYARVLGTGAEPLWREDLMNNLGLDTDLRHGARAAREAADGASSAARGRTRRPQRSRGWAEHHHDGARRRSTGAPPPASG